jgi:hypothetical protein
MHTKLINKEQLVSMHLQCPLLTYVILLPTWVPSKADSRSASQEIHSFN